MRDFLIAVETFLSTTGMAQTMFGRLAAGDSTFVTGIRAGRSPRLVTADRVYAFMAAYQAPKPVVDVSI